MAEKRFFKITNPYESVADLLGNKDNHFKTNLHAHSTVSDAEVDYSDMIKGFYHENFNILAMTDHGVLGRPWNVEPVHLPLYSFQKLLGRSRTKLTDNEFRCIEGGVYPSDTRTDCRGMKCLAQGIELNMINITKAHVNGFFTKAGENDPGKENGFEYAVKLAHDDGGITYINHPGDWLKAHWDVNNAKKLENIRFFAEIFEKYDSCLGIEVCNRVCSDSKNDRILWDELLKYVLPHGKRTVIGFADSDAHVLTDIDTSFMDFILPVFTPENMRRAMETGTFFAESKYARNELGEDFKAEGEPPVVTYINVDEKKQTITFRGKRAEKLQWVADGEIIKEDLADADGNVVSEISLTEYSDKIGCYVRAQLLGKGGALFSQAFICDDGDMARFIIKDERTDGEKEVERLLRKKQSGRIYTLIDQHKKKKARKNSLKK